MRYLHKILFFILCIFLNQSFVFAKKQYAIFVDAGSTGTRLTVFEYQSEQKLSKTLPILTETYVTKSTPGIASFIDHTKDLPNYLKPTFDSAAAILKSKKIPLDTVPIYFLATAGMRLLKPEKQQEIYITIQDFLKKNYPFPIQRMATITGQMEGIYSWLDVNYLANNFHSAINPKRKNLNTVGIIDMGSGSTHIVFATNGYHKSPDEFNLKINQKSYIIFSKNFLGLGQDTARMEMDLYPDSETCYPMNYPISAKKIGNFDAKKCASIYQQILTKHGLKRGQILTQGSPFVGLNGVYYTFHFFETDQQANHIKFDTQITRICRKTWEELQTLYPNDKYLSTYCANGIYNMDLIYHTYKIGNNQLKIRNQINKKSMNWTRGAALYYLFK